jgi:hypothetical protein
MLSRQACLNKVFTYLPTYHDILLKKREMYGFGESALALLRNYLTDRTKKCHLQGMLSKQRKLNCGIPQRSILGPLLSIINIKKPKTSM